MRADALVEVRRGLHERLLRRVDARGLEEVSRTERRLRVREEALAILREERHILPRGVLTKVINEVSDAVVGLGPIEFLLKDPDVTEVMVNGPDDVYVERKGRPRQHDVDHARLQPMRAYGYVRISKLDKDTTSPQRQREAIAKLCADRGWELVRTFEDLDLSAYSKKVRRPGLEQMLGRLGEVDAVVFWRLDRLARSVGQFTKILEATDAAGVKLVATDQSIDTTSASGRAFAQMATVFAELESGTLSERARSMHLFLKENGRWNGGRVPFGWHRGKDGLEPDPDEQATLADAAGRYVAGESLRSISEDLGMYHGNLARMLKSDRVIETLPPSVAGPLVKALAERGRTGRRAKRSLLGGIARCGTCAAGMTLVAQRKADRRKAWAAYACKDGHVSISQPWLDDHVTEAVLSAIDTGKLLKAIEKRKRPRKAMASSELEARLELLERDHYERGIIERESYLRRREGILKRLAAARDAEQDSGIDLPKELAANLSKAWPTLSLPGRRRIIAAVLEGIDVAKAANHGPIDSARVKLVWRG